MYSELLETIYSQLKLTVTASPQREEKFPTFQIMSEQDLAIATKKQKAIPGSYLGSRTYFGKNLFRMMSNVYHSIS